MCVCVCVYCYVLHCSDNILLCIVKLFLLQRSSSTHNDPSLFTQSQQPQPQQNNQQNLTRPSTAFPLGVRENLTGNILENSEANEVGERGEVKGRAVGEEAEGVTDATRVRRRSRCAISYVGIIAWFFFGSLNFRVCHKFLLMSCRRVCTGCMKFVVLCVVVKTLLLFQTNQAAALCSVSVSLCVMCHPSCLMLGIMCVFVTCCVFVFGSAREIAEEVTITHE